MELIKIINNTAYEFYRFKMNQKRKGTGLGLYQPKKKRRKTVSNLPKKEELNTEIHEEV